jgi:NAD(P)-dependent dehydrogenase (short-subunit alcohol dehydrogenase family)
MSDFTQQTVVITGGSGNLGRAVAAAFAARGARLVLADRDAERLQQVGAALAADHSELEWLAQTADLSDPVSVDALIAAAVARFGQVDVLVHTVGGFAMGPKVADGDLDGLRAQFELNVTPLFLTAGRVARHMLERDIAGHIVVVLARSAQKAIAGQSAYTSSKAAAQRVMESLSLEVRDKGIHVNGVLPSIIDTPANRASMPNADFSKWVAPADLAEAIVFLASDAANALHGVSLDVSNRA